MEERDLDAMRKVIGFLCVLAAVLVVVLMMYSQVQPASPDRLIISSIGVDTAVEMVDMLHDGNMATPSLSP